MTVERARKILKAKGSKLSDEQVKELIIFLKEMAKLYLKDGYEVLIKS